MHFFYKPNHHLKEEGEHIIHKIILPIAMLSPIMTIPQVFQVWTAQGKVEGVSITTWAGYGIGTLFWAIYGYAHKDKPLFFANLFLFVMDVLIVVGVLSHS